MKWILLPSSLFNLLYRLLVCIDSYASLPLLFHFIQQPREMESGLGLLFRLFDVLPDVLLLEDVQFVEQVSKKRALSCIDVSEDTYVNCVDQLIVLGYAC